MYFFLLNTFLKRVDAHKVPAFRRTLFIYMHIYSFTDTSGHHCRAREKSVAIESRKLISADVVHRSFFGVGHKSIDGYDDYALSSEQTINSYIT